MSKLKIALPAFVLFAFIITVPTFGQTPSAAPTPPPAVSNEYQVNAILWQQSSAEYRAIAYQTFALAKLRLDQELLKRRNRKEKSPAIVVDADETVLDNTRFQAELVLRSLPFTAAGWQAWCERGEAGAVPGAVEFLTYAAKRGVRTFYITNRRQPEKAGTMRNLVAAGFPGVTDETVMIREAGLTSSKETRREKVRTKHTIVLLVGDNLNDFADDFSNLSIADRSAAVDRTKTQFGSRFIILPNPMYGDWENSVNNNKSGLTEAQREANRKAALKGLGQ
jgi:5'-nucleotidase (lipoprotein e(P4) family)